MTPHLLDPPIRSNWHSVQNLELVTAVVLFIASKVLEMVPNFNFSSRDPGHVHFNNSSSNNQIFISPYASYRGVICHAITILVCNIDTKYEVSICNRSKDIERVPKSSYWNDDPVPLTLDFLNPKSTSFDRVPRTIVLPSFKSFRSGVFVLSC